MTAASVTRPSVDGCRRSGRMAPGKILCALQRTSHLSLVCMINQEYSSVSTISREFLSSAPNPKFCRICIFLCYARASDKWDARRPHHVLADFAWVPLQLPQPLHLAARSSTITTNAAMPGRCTRMTSKTAMGRSPCWPRSARCPLGCAMPSPMAAMLAPSSRPPWLRSAPGPRQIARHSRSTHRSPRRPAWRRWRQESLRGWWLRHRAGARAAAGFDRTGDQRLAGSAAARPARLGAADIGLVRLDPLAEWFTARPDHGLADLVQPAPGRLIAAEARQRDHR